MLDFHGVSWHITEFIKNILIFNRPEDLSSGTELIKIIKSTKLINQLKVVLNIASLIQKDKKIHISSEPEVCIINKKKPKKI